MRRAGFNHIFYLRRRKRSTRRRFGVTWIVGLRVHFFSVLTREDKMTTEGKFCGGRREDSNVVRANSHSARCSQEVGVHRAEKKFIRR